MQSRVNVDYNNKQAVSDIFTLTNVVTNQSLALIPSDSEGNFNWHGITKAPLTRNAMQTTTSSGEWSDLEYPWQAIQQEDWTGGRGNLRFSSDKSRFFDSKRAQTAFRSCIYNAPLDYYADGSITRAISTNCPGSLYWEKVSGNKKYIAVKYICGSVTNAGEVYIHLKRRGNPASPLTVELCSSLTGATVLASHDFTTDEITDTLAEFRKFAFTTVTLTQNVTYYVRVHSDSGTSNDHWEVGCNAVSDSNTYISPSGNTFQTADFEMYYRVAAPQNDYRCKFFTYEQLTFAVRQQKENGTPTLLMNGDIGKVTSSTSTTITDSSKSWTADQWVGAKIGLIYGNGAQEHVDCWRTITENTATTITVDSDFTITPAADVVFIINDTPLWKTITGHGLTAHVTDIHVIRGVVYFAQGDYTDVIKMRWNNGAFEYKTLTGIKATFLQSVRDRNGMMLYRARNDDSKKRTVDRSVLLDWMGTEKTWTKITTAVTTTDGGVVTSSVDFGTGDYDQLLYKITIANFTNQKQACKLVITLQESEDNKAFVNVQSVTATADGDWYINAHCQYRYRRFQLVPSGTGCSANNIDFTTTQIPHFVDKVYLLDNYGKITKLFEYGSEQEKSLWIFQEGMVSSINKTENTEDTYHLDRINIDELQTTAEEHNGKAVGTSDVYLLWSWLNGLQRYYNTQLEGKGPDHDEGLPKDKRGRITQILSYPSNFFVSIDGGKDGYSSIMLFNGNGWHNLYQAPNKGERIHDIAFQPIYGNRPDRLWANVGDDIIWLAMPSRILYALHDEYAEYTHESVVVSSWLTGGMAEVDKLWQSLSIMADYLGDTCWIEADYQLDDDETWHPIPDNPYTVSPQQEELFANENESINGKKLRYRLRLQTTDMHKTPKVNVVLIKCLGRVDIKYSYSFAFRNIQYKADLAGNYEELEPYELDAILSEWANSLATLRLNSAFKIYDNKRVFLDALQTSVVYEKGEGYLSQITLTEI